ncbi:UDP-N-acetylglucosamine 2-epimerase [Silvanigrella sp.]|jgi:GDP/UDP-N,N'-diacetylbacillosamine 2-epimerase (hydrolysing)|uniref:UDP-N-acetylglucosamine 2-epimerase n=1 Tax=Silvanigrella sp. TaxID=2024976 RepID=UPI0037CB21EA|nr:UDP-N-acetylglucosamine 2-epimerase (hydrolyzing) [Silvanigrellaceae bacterium]
MKTKRKICVVTGTRAEYGLLKHLIKEISNSDDFELILFVTGSHLSNTFGTTYKEIEEDGFIINRKIDLQIEGDNAIDIANSTSLSISGFSQAYADFNPDLILILGDRYELLGAAISALFHRIPIAHLHGGEVTLGAMDESIRHALTKFSHIHFVAANEYRNRVIQLGENPDYVFNVGGLGVDAIHRINLLPREQIEKYLKLKFKKKNLLITFHPVTLENLTSCQQMGELLKALTLRKDCLLIFTMPNADQDSKILAKMIEEFVKENDNSVLFQSLGQLLYLSCLSQVDAVIGNSSSGLLEAPSFRKATINIGDRQKGRLKASSVIDCEPNFESIRSALDDIYKESFQSNLHSAINPYGERGSVDLIMQHLRKISFDNLLKKKFHDLV